MFYSNSFVFPYLIYCSEVWVTASDIHLQSLIQLQNKIGRIINYCPYNSPTKIIFQQLNILPLKKTCISNTCFTNMNLVSSHQHYITCLKKIVLFIHITLGTGTNFDLLQQIMRTEIKILGLSLYTSGTMFVTILSLMCPFYRSKIS